MEYDKTSWLPTTSDELKLHNWHYLDVIIFTGDAYIDHPSFGAAVIGRTLESLGLKVAIVPQPNWRDDLRDFKKLGKPNLFFAVTSGNMDSMVNHYTANKRLRSDDAYTPGNKAGFRPDYAAYVYTNIVKKLYPDTPVILGGIEASLRRFTHYDYWQDTLKPSILAETKADLLVYGLGEFVLAELVDLLRKRKNIDQIIDLQQTAYLTYELPQNQDFILLHSYEECLEDKYKFAENFVNIETQSNILNPKTLIEPVGGKFVVVNPPKTQITQQEIDLPYSYAYTRLPHPRYAKRGTIPAYEMIKHSVNIHRGCFGGCAFCTISAHQGKFILSRSENSILKEIEQITKMPDFKGHISDLGGPSANMYKMQGKNLDLCNKCKRYSCIFPKICNNLDTDHSALRELYLKAYQIPGIKLITIGSGIRYDLLFDNSRQITAKNLRYLEQLVNSHISGRLKVAPEHTNNGVLRLMRKPDFEMFRIFKKHFESISSRLNKNFQIVPYFISSHPGCTLENMAELAVETRKMNFHLEQVQDFTPTPLTASSVMYYCGFEPYTRQKIFIARTTEQKQEQQVFFFWYKKEKQQIIKQKLVQLNRKDLIDKLFNSKKST